MSVISRNLNQQVTYWAMTGSDGYGGFTFAAPALLPARWEDKAELFQNDNNEEQVSKAVIYTEVDIETGDYLILGDYVGSATPLGLSKAYRVCQKFRSTDLRNLRSVRKVYV